MSPVAEVRGLRTSIWGRACSDFPGPEGAGELLSEALTLGAECPRVRFTVFRSGANWGHSLAPRNIARAHLREGGRPGLMLPAVGRLFAGIGLFGQALRAST